MTAQPQPALRLTLPESLDTAAARPLLAELTSARGRPLVLDASAVRRIGGLSLQVLLAARVAWASDGLSLRIAQPSPDLRDGLALMGCAALADLSAPDQPGTDR